VRARVRVLRVHVTPHTRRATAASRSHFGTGMRLLRELHSLWLQNVPYCMSHVTRHTSRVTRHTSHILQLRHPQHDHLLYVRPLG
jgi:hypothetical protein